MENTQKPDAFVFITKGNKYTCVSITALDILNNLGLEVVIANEKSPSKTSPNKTLPRWGYDAKEIMEELHTLGVDHKQYRYREGAPLNTKQLQALISLYLSFADPEPAPDAPRFI